MIVVAAIAEAISTIASAKPSSDIAKFSVLMGSEISFAIFHVCPGFELLAAYSSTQLTSVLESSWVCMLTTPVSKLTQPSRDLPSSPECLDLLR